MKSIYQKFLDFKDRHGLSNHTITQIALEYANSNFEFARSHFSKKYNLSEKTFYKARDYAIVCCLVNQKVCSKIREKSSSNYRNNNDKNSAVISLSHFEDLMLQRAEFLNGFSREAILIICQKYGNGTPIDEIAKIYDTGEFAISLLLKKGITELICDADTVKKIQAFSKNDLSKILQERETTKKLILDSIQGKISCIELQISRYDLFSKLLAAETNVDLLTIELQNAKEMYKKALQL